MMPSTYLEELSPTDARTVRRALRIIDARMREPGKIMDSPDLVGHHLALSIGAEPAERFVVAYLDSQHRLIRQELHAVGTVTQAAVRPREVARRALELHASAVILGHNHPSGDLEPSPADEVLTATIKRALRGLDVRVLDHVIVSGNRWLSMAERGLV